MRSTKSSTPSQPLVGTPASEMDSVATTKGKRVKV